MVTVLFRCERRLIPCRKDEQTEKGNIRKRKDGRWEGRYTAGYDPESGKRIIKNVLGKTQAEVKEKLKSRDQRKSAAGRIQSWDITP